MNTNKESSQKQNLSSRWTGKPTQKGGVDSGKKTKNNIQKGVIMLKEGWYYKHERKKFHG